jgi:hypothetical protein
MIDFPKKSRKVKLVKDQNFFRKQAPYVVYYDPYIDFIENTREILKLDKN